MLKKVPNIFEDNLKNYNKKYFMRKPEIEIVKEVLGYKYDDVEEI